IPRRTHSSSSHRTLAEGPLSSKTTRSARASKLATAYCQHESAERTANTLLYETVQFTDRRKRRLIEWHSRSTALWVRSLPRRNGRKDSCLNRTGYLRYQRCRRSRSPKV